MRGTSAHTGDAAIRFLPPCVVLCFEGEGRLAPASPQREAAEGRQGRKRPSRDAALLRRKRDRKAPLVFLPPSLPERFPAFHRLPLWCASSLACTFRSPVLIRSFCLRVFAFPFGSAARGLSRVIHPGHIRAALQDPLSPNDAVQPQLFSPFFVQAAQEEADHARRFLYT